MGVFRLIVLRVRIVFFVLFFYLVIPAFQSATAQNESKSAMQKLSFMTGDWVGISALVENNVAVEEIPAFQKITFELDSSILVIELKSTRLQLHTIIGYDMQAGKYYYQPFSKKGSRKLMAEYKDGQFIVSSSENQRFVFSTSGREGFREFGERRIRGEWVKYFEDNFKRIK